MWNNVVRTLCAIAAGALAPPTFAGEPIEDPPEYFEEFDEDLSGRPVVEVWIGGAGPYRFLVDTGANRTSVSLRLAEELGFVADPAQIVHGVTGASALNTVRVGGIRVGDTELAAIEAPIIATRIMRGVDGLLAADAFVGKRLQLDFDRNTVTVTESSRRLPRGERRVDAVISDGGLPLVEATLGGVTTRVILDSGAEATLGNAALRRSIDERRWNRWERTTAEIHGVTDHVISGDLAMVPRIRVGKISMRNVPVFFADLHIFKIWRLEDEPALLIGMDVMNAMNSLTIDYGAGDVYVGARQDGAKVRLTYTGSRLRRGN